MISISTVRTGIREQLYSVSGRFTEDDFDITTIAPDRRLLQRFPKNPTQAGWKFVLKPELAAELKLAIPLVGDLTTDAFLDSDNEKPFTMLIVSTDYIGNFRGCIDEASRMRRVDASIRRAIESSPSSKDAVEIANRHMMDLMKLAIDKSYEIAGEGMARILKSPESLTPDALDSVTENCDNFRRITIEADAIRKHIKELEVKLAEVESRRTKTYRDAVSDMIMEVSEGNPDVARLITDTEDQLNNKAPVFKLQEVPAFS